ncbi:MAG: TolC family protein, partial [Lentisphaerae bacterium]|nr:TolC family protein [Lentisphaerota bacterium]
KLRNAFIALWGAQERVRITNEIHMRRKQVTDLIRLRYKAGREHKGSLLTAEAKEAEAKLETEEAERDMRLKSRALCVAMGWDDYRLVCVSEPMNIAALSDWASADSAQGFQKFVVSTLSVQQLEIQRKIAGLRTLAARGEHSPDVTLRGSVSRSSSDWPPDDDSWSAGVSLSIPLFSGGSVVNGVKKARNAEERAEANLRSGINDSALSLHGKWNDVKNAVDYVEVMRKYLVASRERAKISEAEYSNGYLSFDSWIIIEDEFIRFEKSLLSATMSALSAEAGWIHAIGGTLENENE